MLMQKLLARGQITLNGGVAFTLDRFPGHTRCLHTLTTHTLSKFTKQIESDKMPFGVYLSIYLNRIYYAFTYVSMLVCVYLDV